MSKLNEVKKPRSVLYYNRALNTFDNIKKMWRDPKDLTDYQYIDLLDKVENFQKRVNAINIHELKDYLEKEGKNGELLDKIKHNIKIFKNDIRRIGAEILGASYYDDLFEAVPRYIRSLQKKSPLKYSGDISELSKRFVSNITHPDNVDMYKNNIEAIIKGTATLPLFSRLFDALIKEKRTPGDVKSKEAPRGTPPEMFDPEGKAEWEETLKQQKMELEAEREERADKLDVTREKPKEFKKNEKDYIKLPSGEEISYDFRIKDKHGVVTYYRDGEELYTYLHEGFISLKNYKKYMI